MEPQECLLSLSKRKTRVTTIWLPPMLFRGTSFRRIKVQNNRRGRRRASRSKRMTTSLTLGGPKWISLRKEPGTYL